LVEHAVRELLASAAAGGALQCPHAEFRVIVAAVFSTDRIGGTMRVNGPVLLLSLAAVLFANAPARAASVQIPTIADCTQACEANNERVGDFKVEGNTVHCVCECKDGWARKTPGAVCERRSTTADPAMAFCKAKMQVAADGRAIKQLNFGNDAESFEMFEKTSRTQKAKFEEKVLGALLDQGLEATTMAAKSAKSLNPVSVNAAIDKLRKSGLNNEAIVAALHAIADTRDKPAMAEAYKTLVHLVRSAKEGYDTGKDMAEEPGNAKLRLLLGVLNVPQRNPELGLVVTGADFGESLAYLGYISAKVGDLTQVTDDKLLQLKSLVARMRGDMTSLQRARSQWKAANAGSGQGEPDCQP